MQLIFLRNGEQSRTALDLILKLIADTQGPLRIAVAYFNYLEIADAIVRRSELGRATFMIVNSSDLLRPAEGFMEYEVSEAILRILGKGSWTSPLEVRSLGLPSPQYHNMHHKFAVGDDRAIFGSVNWTRAALSTNFELMAVTQDAELVNAF